MKELVLACILTDGGFQLLKKLASFLFAEGSLVHYFCNLPEVLWLSAKTPVNAYDIAYNSRLLNA